MTFAPFFYSRSEHSFPRLSSFAHLYMEPDWPSITRNAPNAERSHSFNTSCYQWLTAAPIYFP